MQRIPTADLSKAAGKTKEQLDAVHRKMGRVPNLHATMANSPAVLTAYLRLNDALSQTSLDNRLRELLAVTVASLNDSEYCLSAHTATGKNLKLDETELMRAQEGVSADPKTLAALTFAKALVQKRGRVSDAEVSALKTAGFGNAAILEIVASTVMNIFTNYCNQVAVTEVDFPRVRAAVEGRAGASPCGDAPAERRIFDQRFDGEARLASQITALSAPIPAATAAMRRPVFLDCA